MEEEQTFKEEPLEEEGSIEPQKEKKKEFVEEPEEKEKTGFRFDLLAMFLLVIGIGCSFIGSFYSITIEGDVVASLGLGNLLTGSIVGNGGRLLLLFVLLIIPAIAILVSLSGRWFKKANLIAFLILFTDAVLSCLVPFILEKILPEGHELTETFFCSKLPTITLFVSASFMMVNEERKEPFGIRDITEMGILIAAAVGLNFLRLFKMPTGGSVNLQMLPLFIIALRRGPLKGFIAGGIVYGLISILIDGYMLPCYPFDYLLGFGSVMVLGFFQPLIFGKNQKGYNFKGELFIFLGCVIATTIRFIGSNVSSVLLWGYDLAPAMLYNVGYIYVSGALATVVVMAIYGPLVIINSRFPPNGRENYAS